MQITIEVPDGLAAVAATRGQTAEVYAAELLSRSVVQSEELNPALDPEEFVRQLSKFSDQIHSSPSSTYTREEIYADHD